jgi:hypothetical protein
LLEIDLLTPMWELSRENAHIVPMSPERHLMQVPSPSQAALIGSLGVTGGASQPSNERIAFEAARKLNNLQISGREYSVARDPQSQRFAVVVLDEKTGTALDQFPPEEILRMLAQLAAFRPGNARTNAAGESLA